MPSPLACAPPRRRPLCAQTIGALLAFALLLPACTPSSLEVDPAVPASATATSAVHSKSTGDLEPLTHELNEGGAGEALYYDLQAATLEAVGGVAAEVTFVPAGTEGQEEARASSCEGEANLELCLAGAEVATSFVDAYGLPLYATSVTLVPAVAAGGFPDPCPPPEIDPGQPDLIRIEPLLTQKPLAKVPPEPVIFQHGEGATLYALLASNPQKITLTSETCEACRSQICAPGERPVCVSEEECACADTGTFETLYTERLSGSAKGWGPGGGDDPDPRCMPEPSF